MIVVPLLAVIVAAYFLTTLVIIPNAKYNKAVALMDAGQYEEAIAAFEAMDGYKDSTEQIYECKYRPAVALMDAGEYEEAQNAFGRISKYKDSADKITECKYLSAVALENAGEYEEAQKAFDRISEYKDSADRSEACKTAFLDGKYANAVALLNEGKAREAYSIFAETDGYKDSEEKTTSIAEAQYQEVYAQVSTLVDSGECGQAKNYYTAHWHSAYEKYVDSTKVKELKDYYQYAKMILTYETGDLISLNGYLSALKQISSSFKDVSERINRVQSVLNSYSGFWTKKGNIYYSEYAVEINAINGRGSFGSSENGKFKYTLYEGALRAHLKDGAISDIQFADDSSDWHVFKLALNSSGNLTVQKYFIWFDGSEILEDDDSGTYKKVA